MHTFALVHTILVHADYRVILAALCEFSERQIKAKASAKTRIKTKGNYIVDTEN